MPNIIGTTPSGDFDIDSNVYSGAFRHGGTIKDGSAGGGAMDHYANFNASWSNAIYGSSETVQPPSFVLLPQIKY